MKKHLSPPSVILFSVCVLLLAACGAKQSEVAADMLSESVVFQDLAEEKPVVEYELAKAKAEDDPSGLRTALSSSVAKIGAADSTRKLIRTAEISFTAKNVVKTVYAIEDIAVRHGGFVQKSDLTKSDWDTQEIRIGGDSTLRLTEYRISGEMTLRVPVAKLDTTLKDIARLVEQLKYRKVLATDVTLSVLRTSLDRKRESRAAARMETAVDNRGRKLGETIEGEEAVANRQERADEALLAGLELKDQIEFSTLQLSIYQSNSLLLKERIANEDRIENYEAGFGYRLLNALQWGGEAIVDFVLSLVHLWAFILLAVAAVWGMARWRRKRKKTKS